MNDLATLISSVIRVRAEDLADSMSMQDVPAWDSLAHMELIAEIENRYGIQLTADEIVTMTRVDRIREILETRGVA